MIEFYLNNTLVQTVAPGGTTVLDFIRKTRRLTGSKLACGEGECGACTILVGNLKSGEVEYLSMTSCLMPLANAHGKHLVTIEGLEGSPDRLTAVQDAMVAANGTQCGFCTPGFVMSLTGSLLANQALSIETLIAGMDGNMCRCTGYKSIERAARAVLTILESPPENGRIGWLVQKNILPAWFDDIADKLVALTPTMPAQSGAQLIGGGSDLYVQQPYTLHTRDIAPLYDQPQLHGIEIVHDRMQIGASETMASLQTL